MNHEVMNHFEPIELGFTEEAQDFYNEKFDEIETLINNTLNVWNKQTI